MRIAIVVLLAVLASAGAFAQQPGVQVLPLPSASNTREWLTALLPDGSLVVAAWSLPSEQYVLRRVLPDGTMTLLHTFAAGEPLRGVVVATDGRVWYADAGSVGRVNLTGGITPVATLSLIDTILAAPGGVIWVLRHDPGSVVAVRIALDGTLTQTPLPTSIAGFAIAAPDGALWFADYGGARLIRVSPTGVVTSHALPWNPGVLALSNRYTLIVRMGFETVPEVHMEVSLTGEMLGELDGAAYRTLVPQPEWERNTANQLVRHVGGSVIRYPFPPPAYCPVAFHLFTPLGTTADGHLWVLRTVHLPAGPLIGTPPCTGLTPDPPALLRINVNVFASSHGAADLPLSPAALAVLIAILGIAAFLRLRV